jgi:ribosomal protein S18 acetylase RimI-like enzyme
VPPAEPFRILVADTPALLAEARRIIREYADGLGIDLCFQNLGAELDGLPGDYAQPAGVLLLALVDGEVGGCGAVRPMTDVDYPDACEMKRLFVRPPFRRLGMGQALARELVDHATQVGYSVMLLDTLDEMEAARGMYEAMGFEEIPPYYFNPIPGAHYLKLDLRTATTRF